MERELLYSVLFEQQREFMEGTAGLVERDLTGALLKLVPLRLPVVITGVRRCGKSSLLRLLKDRIGLDGKSCFYVNFNDGRLVDFSVEDFQKLLDFMDAEHYKGDCFLFIDEIQEVEQWERWVDRIREKHLVFITGSNSKLLSSEISSTLTGRSINVSLMPFSFREFLDAKHISIERWELDLEVQARARKAFKEFLHSGGFPKLVLSNQKIIVSELYENILYRDVIARFNKNLVKPIKEVSLWLLSNATNQVSYRELAKMAGIKNISTVKSMINAFEGSFLFFFTGKFDFSVKKQTQNPKKIYAVDNGFITAGGFRFSADNGKLLENLVAIELKRQGKEIFYSKGINECDFVVKKGAKITEAIQVCYALNGVGKDGEMRGLLEAMRKFGLKEGRVLTNDQEEELLADNKKISVVPVWKWLLRKRA